MKRGLTGKRRSDLTEPMSTPERIAVARDCLQTEEARVVFDQLLILYPNVSVFWNTEEGHVELGLYPQHSQSSTLKYPSVSITIS